MYRTAVLVAVLMAAATWCVAEELVLKDGTKIVGKMTAISGDRIEVETAYGKMQLNRADLVSISFPDNKAAAAASDKPKADLPNIDETLHGSQYLNKTAKFSLTLPADWKVNPRLRISPDVMAALSSQDNLRYLLVTQEDYSGSVDSYKGLVEIQSRKNLHEYEMLSQSKMVIDGKPSVLFSYRGVSSAANNLPVQFLSAIIPSGKKYTRITTWCVEPLFNETQGMFEKIIDSYRELGATAAEARPVKP